MSKIDIFNPIGGIDQDTDLLYVKKGDYRDALNVRHLTDNTGSTGSIVPVKGNTLSFTIPQVPSQNKIYTITQNFTTDILMEVEVRSTRGDIFATGLGPNIAALASAIDAALIAAGFTQTVVVGATSFTLEITSKAGWEYLVVSTGFHDVKIQVNQDAITTLEAGEVNIIGSYDVRSVNFIWSTPQTVLPSVIVPTVIGSVDNGSGTIRVTTSANHGLADGQRIRIGGAETASSINGEWVITLINPNSFDLFASVPSAVTATTGSITINEYGVAEIGVTELDQNTEAWTYTRLLRSRKLNFVTKHQIDPYVELKGISYNINWVDDYNVMRTMQYVGDFVTDGALDIVREEGNLDLDTITEETSLILNNTDVVIDFKEQLNGGAVPSGSWRYAVRLLTISLNGTQYSDPTNIVSAGTVTDAVFGLDSADPSSRINVLTVTGITPGIYAFAELIGIHYSDRGISGTIIRRDELLDSDTSVDLRHTGTEADSSIFDLTLLAQAFPDYVSARSMDVIDKRMVLSGLKVREIQDYSEWALTFKHSVKSKSLAGVRDTAVFGINVTAEYQLPSNINDFTGLMLNETYRWGVKVNFIGGGVSPMFFIDDIIINTEATNSAGDDPSRRVAGLANYELTNADGTTVFVPFIEFSSIDLDFTIDGVPVRDLISSFEIERAEVVNPTILATGMIAMGVEGVGDSGLAYDSTGSPGNGEYPWISDGLVTAIYPGASFTENRHYSSLYSPDHLYGQVDLEFQAGDELISYGSPSVGFVGPTATPGAFDSGYGFYRNNHGTINLSGSNIYTISDAKQMLRSSQVDVGSKTYFSELTNGTELWRTECAFIINTNGQVNDNNTLGNSDYGFYCAQYRRPVAQPYGSKINQTYVTCGHSFDITNFTGSTIGLGLVEVFGGDVFTQKSYLKHRYTDVAGDGLGGGVAFYSQNRVNTQMKSEQGTVGVDYPGTPLLEWLESRNFYTFGYNFGYNVTNDVKLDSAFDSSAVQNTDLGTRIIYSEPSPASSRVNNYRSYALLDFLDLNQNDGPIVHHVNFNGELITFQATRIIRQYFNNVGSLTVSDSSQVVIGAGSVMNRDGNTISTIGSSHKWAIIKGRTANGRDVLYWIDSTLKKVIRMSQSGIEAVSDTKGMQSFFANNLRYVQDQDSPADGTGIHGVFDNRNAEVVFTIRGQRTDIDGWLIGDSYVIGDLVSFGSTVYEGTDTFYRALTNNTGKLPSVFPADWEAIPHTDNSFYNEYTIIFSEFKDKFTTFFSFKPKIYLGYQDTYLSPNPVSDTGEVFLHNVGDYCSWYSGNQQADGFLQGITNMAPMEIKWAMACRFNTKIVPKRVDFENEDQISFLLSPEFEGRELNWDSPIKEDSTVSGVNDADTSLLFGRYLLVKLTFEKLVYQEFYGVGIKQKFSPRLITK